MPHWFCARTRQLCGGDIGQHARAAAGQGCRAADFAPAGHAGERTAEGLSCLALDGAALLLSPAVACPPLRLLSVVASQRLCRLLQQREAERLRRLGAAHSAAAAVDASHWRVKAAASTSGSLLASACVLHDLAAGSASAAAVATPRSRVCEQLPLPAPQFSQGSKRVSHAAMCACLHNAASKR